MKQILFFATLLLSFSAIAQNKMTAELLWKLGRVSGLGISKDGKYILYSVGTPNAAENKTSRKTYAIPVTGGNPMPVSNTDSMLTNEKISADGKYMISSAEVKVKKLTGKENYTDLQKSNVYIFDNLNYRHWDTYEDGNFDHVMLTPLQNGVAGTAIDLMPGEPYDCPQKPSGGDEDFVWNPNGKEVVYCTKKKYGTAYAISTNTDLFAYNIETGKTKNLTEGMMGYDINPSFNSKGEMAWLSMKRDGFESDKQDLIVSNGITKMNLTASRDDIHVEGYRWSDDGRNIFFYAPINGTLQLFVVNYPGLTKMAAVVKQITKGDFDVNGIIGQSGNTLIVSRTDMNHAAEIYSVDITNGNMAQLTHVNDETYATLSMSKTERRFVKTTDGKDMLVWVIYPPDFDADKKIPNTIILPGRATICVNAILLYPLEFSIDGCQWLHRGSTKPQGHAGPWHQME